ncbi:MAG: pyridoxamine 5'-phosphate oxidase family protein [Candidatus Thermoplasmatota archaeon]|nr:pyridoxamine 5'-phosphate oxidase family protein [Candidatus Thermoplasmatota archaeon]
MKRSHDGSDRMPGEQDEVNEVLGSIKDLQLVYMATIDGKIPRVRPLTMVRFGSEHYILTGANDAKMRQLSENDNVEVCMDVEDGKGTGYIRIEGKMEIVKDRKLKGDVAMSTSYFSEYWSTPEDPAYALLHFKMKNLEFLGPGEIYSRKSKL